MHQVQSHTAKESYLHLTWVTDTVMNSTVYNSKYRSESSACLSTLNERREPVQSQLIALTPIEAEVCPPWLSAELFLSICLHA